MELLPGDPLFEGVEEGRVVRGGRGVGRVHGEWLTERDGALYLHRRRGEAGGRAGGSSGEGEIR